jgi:hypothetical protein
MYRKIENALRPGCGRGSMESHWAVRYEPICVIVKSGGKMLLIFRLFGILGKLGKLRNLSVEMVATPITSLFNLSFISSEM